jgi:ribosomal-protein-alanine N-acetyltransferase
MTHIAGHDRSPTLLLPESLDEYVGHHNPLSTIHTERTSMRPWNEDDASDLFEVFSSPEAMRFWNAPPTPSVDAVRANIARSIAAPAEVHKSFAIILRETGRAIGLVNYHHREPANRRLEIGYILSPAHQGRGLAHEAVSAFVTFCFIEFACNRVEALTDPENVASSKLLERLGFKCEGGPLRQRILLGDGTFGDQVVYALLASERGE